MKTLLIRNPVAGQRDVEDDLRRVTRYLQDCGWQVSLRQTEGHRHATTLAREAVEDGYDLVVAVGGDGTVGEVATGLAGSPVAMGVLPVGTGNLWARMLGLPVWSPTYRTALQDAARVLVEGDRRQVDVGRVGERCFVMWCGIGFDAQIVHDVEPHREVRRSLGNLTYVVMAVAEALAMRGTRATVVVDGRAMRFRVMLVVIANAQLYGPSLRLAPHAKLDDGLLDVFVFRGTNLLDVIRHVALLASGRHAASPTVEALRGRQIYIVADRPLPIHLDGDPGTATPISVQVMEKSLTVIVPSWAPATLFCGDESEATAHERPGGWLRRRRRQPGD